MTTRATYDSFFTTPYHGSVAFKRSSIFLFLCFIALFGNLPDCFSSWNRLSALCPAASASGRITQLRL